MQNVGIDHGLVSLAGCALGWYQPRAFRHAWTDARESCIIITLSFASLLHCNTAQAVCSDTGWRAMKGYV